METFALLVNCIIDDALLETVPYIDQPLLQFIYVINVLLHDTFVIDDASDQ